VNQRTGRPAEDARGSSDAYRSWVITGEGWDILGRMEAESREKEKSPEGGPPLKRGIYPGETGEKRVRGGKECNNPFRKGMLRASF